MTTGLKSVLIAGFLRLILTLSTFLCFELQQPQKLEVLKEFILHEYGSSGLLSQGFSNFTMVLVFIYFVWFFFSNQPMYR